MCWRVHGRKTCSDYNAKYAIGVTINALVTLVQYEHTITHAYSCGEVTNPWPVR